MSDIYTILILNFFINLRLSYKLLGSGNETVGTTGGVGNCQVGASVVSWYGS